MTGEEAITMARAMRRLLVDHARRHKADKHGGGNDPLTLTESRMLTDGRPPSFADLDDVLKELAEMDPAKVEIVDLHLFAGLTFDEIADLKKVSRTTTFMEWRKARLWIYHRLRVGYGYGS